MKRSAFVTRGMAFGFLLSGLLALPSLRPSVLAAEDQSILQADHEFVQATGKGDVSTLGKLLDTDFTWTDADGKTRTKSEVLDALPTPALGNETGAQVKQQIHSQVGAVMSGRNKTHVLRIWVRRPAGWRLLVYHEVVLGRQTSAPAGSGVKDWENPCKTF